MARLPARMRSASTEDGAGGALRAREGSGRDESVLARSSLLDTSNGALAGVDQIEAIVDALDRTVIYRLVQPRRPSSREPDGGARVVYMSRNIERIFGIEAASVLEQAAAWYGLIDPAELPRVLAEQHRAFADGDRFDMDVPFIIERGDIRGRRIFRINSTPQKTGDGTIVWNGSISDITRSAEQRRLTEVAEVSPDLVGTVDAQGRIVYLNRAGHDMLGLEWTGDPDAQVASIGIETLHPPDMQDLYWNEIVPAVKRDDVWSGETNVVDRHGRSIPVSQVVVAHRGPASVDGKKGPITHLSTIVRDMSARVELEERLRTARLASERARDAAETARAHAEAVTSEVNHRVKNLFAVVPAIVQLSARATEDVRELTRLVRERVSALVRSHELTLNANGELTGVPLSELVEAVLRPYRDEHATVEMTGPTVTMSARDGNALSLMLHELSTNAAKYGALSGRGGRLAVNWFVGPRRPTVPPSVGDEEDRSRWTELTLTWRERLPTGADALPDQPERTGSGTLLLDRFVRVQQGTIVREWDRGGLTVSMVLPIHGARVNKGAAPL